MKKEKPLIQHPTDPLSTQAELPVPQLFFDDRSTNLSEKEIIDLFEKMMVSWFDWFSSSGKAFYYTWLKHNHDQNKK